MSEQNGPETPDGADDWERRLQGCLDKLAAGDPAARNELFGVAYGRLEYRARKMLSGFKGVKGFYDTGDVAQEAAIALDRSLQAIHPENPRRFLGLVALHVKRTLIDLYRKCQGRESYEANRATNVFYDAKGHLLEHVNQLPAPGEDADQSAWERLHEAVGELDADAQELFNLRWILGLTHAQIAAQLGVSEKTVIRSWTNVKNKLREEFRGQAGL